MKYSILEDMFEGESPKSVLEVGCANGGLLKDLAETFPGLKVGGMEISQDLKGAKELFPDQADNFIQHDITDPWPFEDKSYDIVFSCGVLMYIFEPVGVVKEMLRVGKKVVIAEHHNDQLSANGALGEAFTDQKSCGTGIVRNYYEVFQKIGGPLYIKARLSNGKTIFTLCQQKNEQLG